jgi:hypothetical protein
MVLNPLEFVRRRLLFIGAGSNFLRGMNTLYPIGMQNLMAFFDHIHDLIPIALKNGSIGMQLMLETGFANQFYGNRNFG